MERLQRHYLELEDQFIRFSKGLGVRASELDALMWLEMMASPSAVHSIMGMGHHAPTSNSRGRTKKSKPNPGQLTLIS